MIKTRRRWPLDLMLTQVAATTNIGDVVWEPFGGLASASVASVLLGRRAYAAEIDATFVALAKGRLEEAQQHVATHGIYKMEDVAPPQRGSRGR